MRFWWSGFVEYSVWGYVWHVDSLDGCHVQGEFEKEGVYDPRSPRLHHLLYHIRISANNRQRSFTVRDHQSNLLHLSVYTRRKVFFSGGQRQLTSCISAWRDHNADWKFNAYTISLIVFWMEKYGAYYNSIEAQKCVLDSGGNFRYFGRYVLLA